MLTDILSALTLLLIGADLFLFLQVVRRLKQHGDKPLDTQIPYLSPRLTAFVVNSIAIAAIQIILIFLR